MTDGSASARLFVALPLPSPVVETLLRLQPPPQRGVRLIDGDDLHVTLHFLGLAETEAVREALGSVRAGRFPLRLERPGHFSLRRGRRILWVAAATTDEISRLRELTANALARVGFEAETRPFRPHVTLARLGEKAPADIVERFEAGSVPDGGVEFECRRFALYASETAPDGARYRVLESYPLVAGP